MVLLHDVVIVILWQRPHEAKVADLDLFVGGQQDVAGGEVAVDEAARLQVGHAAGDLHRVSAQHRDEDVALALAQTVQQGAQRRQLGHLAQSQMGPSVTAVSRAASLDANSATLHSCKGTRG